MLVINQLILVRSRFKACENRIFSGDWHVGRIFFKKRRLFWSAFLGVFCFMEKFLGKSLKLELCEDLAELLLVGLGHLQLIEVEVDGHICADGGEELRHLDVFFGVFHLLPHFSFELVGVGEELFTRSEFIDQLHGRLLSHAGATGIVVGRVTHEGQQVDDLVRRVDTILLFDLTLADYVVTTPMARLEHKDVWCDELPIVFVGSEHIGLHTGLPSFGSQRADDVVSLKAVGLQDGDVHGLQNLLDIGHTELDVFRCFLALSLIGWVGLVAERLAVVEGHAEMGGMLFVDDLPQRVAKA